MGEEGDEKKKVRGEKVVNPHPLHSLSLLQYFSRKGGGGPNAHSLKGEGRLWKRGGTVNI